MEKMIFESADGTFEMSKKDEFRLSEEERIVVAEYEGKPCLLYYNDYFLTWEYVTGKLVSLQEACKSLSFYCKKVTKEMVEVLKKYFCA